MRSSDWRSDVCSADLKYGCRRHILAPYVLLNSNLALQRQLQGERRGRLDIAIEWTCREQGCRRAQYHLLIGKVFPNQCHFPVIVLVADGDKDRKSVV